MSRLFYDAAMSNAAAPLEEPEHGHIGRVWGPPFQSVVIDLKTPEGLEHCRALAVIADILIENFRPGTMHSKAGPIRVLGVPVPVR